VGGWVSGWVCAHTFSRTQRAHSTMREHHSRNGTMREQRTLAMEKLATCTMYFVFSDSGSSPSPPAPPAPPGAGAGAPSAGAGAGAVGGAVRLAAAAVAFAPTPVVTLMPVAAALCVAVVHSTKVN
jgi:hypothetical protein